MAGPYFFRVPRPSAHRIETVDALRGLAALAVAWFHFTNGGSLLPDGWLKASGSHGWLGVEVFFVLSGFVLPYSLHQGRYLVRRDAGRFLLKRLIRLEPPYLCAVALVVILAYVSAAMPGYRGAPPDFTATQLLLHLGYANAFFGYPWVIPVLWTLAIEFQFYLIIAVIFPLIASASSSTRFAVFALMCVLGAVIQNESLVFRYLPLFVLGMITFTFRTGRMTTAVYVAWLAMAACAAIVVDGHAAAAVGMATALGIGFVNLRRIAPLAFLGSISYSLYLLHVPIGGRVVNLGSRFAHDTMSQVLVLALAVLASIGAAYAFHRVVERPAQRMAASLKYTRR